MFLYARYTYIHTLYTYIYVYTYTYVYTYLVYIYNTIHFYWNGIILHILFCVCVFYTAHYFKNHLFLKIILCVPYHVITHFSVTHLYYFLSLISKRVGKFLLLNDTSVNTPRGALENTLDAGASSTWTPTQLTAEVRVTPGMASPLSGGWLYLFQTDSNVCVIKLSLPLHMRENGGSIFSPVISTLWTELDIEHSTVFSLASALSMTQLSWFFFSWSEFNCIWLSELQSTLSYNSPLPLSLSLFLAFWNHCFRYSLIYTLR